MKRLCVSLRLIKNQELFPHWLSYLLPFLFNFTVGCSTYYFQPLFNSEKSQKPTTNRYCFNEFHIYSEYLNRIWTCNLGITASRTSIYTRITPCVQSSSSSFHRLGKRVHVFDVCQAPLLNFLNYIRCTVIH